MLVECLAIEQRAALRRAGAGMAELDRWHAAELLHELCDPRKFGNLVVAVKTGALVGLAAAVLDRCLLVENDPGATDRVAAHMHDVPVSRRTMQRLVLAHRRNHDAVARG